MSTLNIHDVKKLITARDGLTKVEKSILRDRLNSGKLLLEAVVYDYQLVSNEVLRDILSDSKTASEWIEKKVEQFEMLTTPQKQRAVFPLFKNNDFVGTAFAFNSCRVLTARHNLFDLAATQDSSVRIHIKVGQSFFEMEIEACPNPTAEKPLTILDDWIILRRCDLTPFLSTIVIMVTDESTFDTRPYITIYHCPMEVTVENGIAQPTVVSSPNRVSHAENGRVHCNDLSNVTAGTCGGPYVDDASSGAYGMHIEGMNWYSGLSNRPVALHFAPDSSLVAKLRDMKVLY